MVNGMKATYIIQVFLTFLLVGCNTLSIPDDINGQNGKGQDAGGGKEQKKTETDASLTYFAFLKSDNPTLEADIECGNLNVTNLLLIPGSDLELPCMLKVSFNVDGGKLYCNGDEMVSGESEIYCSDKQDALIRIVGDNGKNQYHFLKFMPYTGLPLIEVNIDDGRNIVSKKEWQKALLTIHGMGQFPDHMDSVYVRKRGNGTAAYPKTAFNVKYSKKRSVLGMPKHKRWVFLANFRDRTEIRNAVALKLGQMADSLEWTPRSQFANVTLNGEFQGLYQVTEQIRVSDKRVPIDEIDASSSDLTGGYLLELDYYFDADWKFKTPLNEWQVNLKSPDEEVCNDSILSYISGYYNDFEQCLKDGDYSELYDKYMDLGSFVDYGIIQSMTNNGEFFNQYSVFNYKKRGGKLYAGPLWDFDYTTFNNPTKQLFTNGMWYKYLRDDATFKQTVKTRWTEIKAKTDPYIFNYIDSLADALTISAHIDETVYPFSEYMPKQLNGDENMTFEEAVQTMKSMLRERIDWMDQKINEL